METLGSYLREERKKQGKTLEQIAKKTCISRTTLQAIEKDQTEQLPPASYLRGFLKLYAQELELSEEDVLSHLPKQTEEKGSLALPEAPDIENPPKPLLKILIAGSIILLVCIWSWQTFFDPAQTVQDENIKIVSPRPTVPDTSPPPETQPKPSENEPETDAAMPELSPELKVLSEELSAVELKPAEEIPTEETPPIILEDFTIKLLAHGLVWMKLQADNNKAVDITLRKGEQYRLSAKQRLTMRIGDPVLVDVFYNNAAVDLPGKKGIPLDVVFPDCVRQTHLKKN